MGVKQCRLVYNRLQKQMHYGQNSNVDDLNSLLQGRGCLFLFDYVGADVAFGKGGRGGFPQLVKAFPAQTRAEFRM